MTAPSNGTSYSDQLKDPRWAALRDRILQRDARRCVQCRAGGELHVHHSHYRDGREPWEYRDADLFTLCKRCHEKVHGLPTMTPGEPPARGAGSYSLQAERARWRADELQDSRDAAEGRDERIEKASQRLEELRGKMTWVTSKAAGDELFRQVVAARVELEGLREEKDRRVAGEAHLMVDQQVNGVGKGESPFPRVSFAETTDPGGPDGRK